MIINWKIFISFIYSVPPPPPIPIGHVPVQRLQSQISREAPACVQNAMMTKDKKPFTYTPGGIDLSQIKSPRMAKRELNKLFLIKQKLIKVFFARTQASQQMQTVQAFRALRKCRH